MSTVEISSETDDEMLWSADESFDSSFDDPTGILGVISDGAPDDLIENILDELEEDEEYICCADHPPPMSFACDFVCMEICGRRLEAYCKNKCIDPATNGYLRGAWLVVHDANIHSREYTYKFLCDQCLVFYSYKYPWEFCHNHGNGKQWHFRPRPICLTKNASSRK